MPTAHQTRIKRQGPHLHNGSNDLPLHKCERNRCSVKKRPIRFIHGALLEAEGSTD